MSTKRALVCAVVLAGTFSCRPDDQRTETLDPVEAMQVRDSWPPEVVAQLDSGSQAFRMDDFDAALSHYQRVTELSPDVGAGWFGVYMAHDALGNGDAAAEALERAQALVPGATLIHDDGRNRP